MNSTSVPKVLLGLGALCLLAASGIFLAVSWSTLGVGGRTAVLASLTLAALGASLGLHRAGLRMAAEALATVTLGLLTLDVYGAAASGLLGGMGDASVTVLAGSLLVAAASAMGAVARPRLLMPQVASGAGLGLAAIGGVFLSGSAPLVVGNLAVVASAGLAWWARRTGLPVQQISCQVAALPAWALAAGMALVNGTSASTVVAVTVLATAVWAALAELRGDLRDIALAPAAAGAAQLGFGLLVATAYDLGRWVDALPAFTHPLLVHLTGERAPFAPALVVPAVLAVAAVLGLLVGDLRRRLDLAVVPLGAGAALAAAAYDVPLALAVGLLVATAFAVLVRYPAVALALLTAAAIGALPSAGLTATAAGIGLVVAGWLALTTEAQPARALAELVMVPLSALTLVGLIEAVAPGTHAVEVGTLPIAAGLLAAGLLRLRRPEVGSEVLLPGLLIAVVPSTLLALGDPLSLRALLVGLGCLVLVLLGAGLRWASPVIVGAAAGTIVVLREMGPYASSVPQWVWIGLAGVLLTTAGITWERQLRDLRRAVTMVGRLR